MRAVQSQQTQFAEFIAKQHQFLAQNFYRLRNIVKISRRPDD